MRILIDLDKSSLSPLELLYLLAIYRNKRFTFDPEKMEEYAPCGDTLSIRGKAALKAVKLEESDDKELDELTDKYRELFKGLSPGIMGSRDNLKKKLKEFKLQYDYSDEHILKAIQRYISSVSDFRYLQRADYTVEKNGDSRLLAFCEDTEPGDNGEDSFTELL